MQPSILLLRVAPDTCTKQSEEQRAEGSRVTSSRGPAFMTSTGALHHLHPHLVDPKGCRRQPQMHCLGAHTARCALQAKAQTNCDMKPTVT